MKVRVFRPTENQIKQDRMFNGSHRDEKCPCGSGLKNKKCCGAKYANAINKQAENTGVIIKDKRNDI